MLLDIAPMADGTLTQVQESRLTEFGKWLKYCSGNKMVRTSQSVLKLNE